MNARRSRRPAGILAFIAGAIFLGSCNNDKLAGVKPPEVVARLSLQPALDTLNIGQTLQLTGTAYAADSTVLPDVALTYSSLNSDIVTVDATGLATAVAEGTANLAVSYGLQTAVAAITVYPVPESLAVTPAVSDIRVGDKIVLLAAPKDAQGATIGGQVTYASSDTNIAAVSPTGQVTAKGEGTVTITASSGGKSASVTINVKGQRPPTDEGLGNNLSVPVVFSEGIGLTGLPVTASGAPSYVNTGLRPAAEEAVAVPKLPFFYVANEPDAAGYYVQQTGDIWQAEWLDGTAHGLQHAAAAWGDNLTHQTWKTSRPIRVEVTLNDLTVGTLTGYNMTVLSGSGTTEVQGTDGTTSAMTPTIFSVVPRLVVQKLSGENGTVVQTLLDKPVAEGLGAEDGSGAFTAEVTVAGKIVYGYNLNISSFTMNPGVAASGWWRISFVLDNSATVGGSQANRNVVIDGVAAAEASEEGSTQLYTPKAADDGMSTWLDIQVDSSTTGGSGSGGGGSGGSGDTSPGNNLSVPVTFAEGIGLTGLPVSQDAGLRPTSEEGVTVDARPFFFTGNTSDCALDGKPYFCQGGKNTWQADWYDASGQPMRQAEVAWGDNLLTNTFNTHMNVHVEVMLTDLTTPAMQGYNMAVISGSGSTELQGTDGTRGSFTPAVYTRGARLKVELLDSATRVPVYTLLDKGVWEAGDGSGQFTTEVSMGGQVVYSYNLLIQNITLTNSSLHKYGWWRFTFTLDDAAPVRPNVRMTRLAASEESGDDSGGGGAGGSASGGIPSKNVPFLNATGQVTSIDVYIAKGGGGGGGHMQ